MSEPTRPAPGEYTPFYETYVSKVGSEPVLEQLATNGRTTTRMLNALDPGLVRFAYAPGKWTLGQVVAHLGDAERVFAYRALHAARGGTGSLPDMDEQGWARTRDVSKASLADLIAELAAIRQTTLFLLRGLEEADWSRAVSVDDTPMTARALAFIIAGHEIHHLNIIWKRYLNG